MLVLHNKNVKKEKNNSYKYNKYTRSYNDIYIESE